MRVVEPVRAGETGGGDKSGEQLFSIVDACRIAVNLAEGSLQSSRVRLMGENSG